MDDQQLIMPTAQICQVLAVGPSSPGQLLLTTVMCCSDVLQSGLQECLKGWLACTICISLEEVKGCWGSTGES